MGDLEAYRATRTEVFSTVSPPAAPAVTLAEVSKLYRSRFPIEIEGVAAA